MPKRLIVDSGVAVKWIIEEPDSTVADQILQSYQQSQVAFYAPDLILPEVGNIIWKKVIFSGLDISDAKAAITKFDSIPFELIDSSSLFDDAFSISVSFKRTFYDSLYLAAANDLECDLVTADERLYNSVKTAFPNLVLMADWTG